VVPLAAGAGPLLLLLLLLTQQVSFVSLDH
jgi:hypothetical protein